jgi:thiol:disulfide interchange protein
VGGLALNLTPCVLPMIPVNLAIIGAGSQAGSKARGFALGLLYGAGIALTYGVLGLVAVLTGSTFGTLNASPWFNWIIAVVFVVLALAMFDVLHVDFSRFQNRLPGGGTPNRKGRAAFGAALFMGIVAALLAGACVAPVVISVLVWSGNLYAKGVWLGLLLPFVLGIGMALPWPLAGAGMAVLPRPGGWMNWIKRGFGVLIILLALYYAKLGVDLFQVDSGDLESGLSPAVQQHKLADALQKGLDQEKPVLIDFWATWCKNCTTMDKTTFKDTAVKQVLKQDVIFVKYAAENPEDLQTKQVLSAFGVKGLPTYVIVAPQTSKP